jgi:hypothetical protein
MDMTKLILAFRSFVSAPNNKRYYVTKNGLYGTDAGQYLLTIYTKNNTKQNAKPYGTSLLFTTILRIDTKQLTKTRVLKLLTNNIH